MFLGIKCFGFEARTCREYWTTHDEAMRKTHRCSLDRQLLSVSDGPDYHVANLPQPAAERVRHSVIAKASVDNPEGRGSLVAKKGCRMGGNTGVFYHNKLACQKVHRTTKRNEKMIRKRVRDMTFKHTEKKTSERFLTGFF